MVSNSSSMLFFLGAAALVLVAPASGQGMTVAGGVTCSKTGNPPGLPAGAGIKVTLTCNGSTVETGFTGFNGAFYIFAPSLAILHRGSTGCTAAVRLPVVGCPQLPSSLRANVTAMGPIIPGAPAVGCLVSGW